LAEHLRVPTLKGQRPVAGMERFCEAGPEGLVLWIAVLAVLVTLAYYFIEKIRPKTVQKGTQGQPMAGKMPGMALPG